MGASIIGYGLRSRVLVTENARVLDVDKVDGGKIWRSMNGAGERWRQVEIYEGVRNGYNYAHHPFIQALPHCSWWSCMPMLSSFAMTPSKKCQEEVNRF